MGQEEQKTVVRAKLDFQDAEELDSPWLSEDLHWADLGGLQREPRFQLHPVDRSAWEDPENVTEFYMEWETWESIITAGHAIVMGTMLGVWPVSAIDLMALGSARLHSTYDNNQQLEYWFLHRRLLKIPIN